MATPVTCSVHVGAAPHARQHCDALVKRVADGAFGRQTRTLALAGNARVAPDGAVDHGVLAVVAADMRLADARPLMGSVLSGRIGVYPLRGAPKNLQTVTQVAAAINGAGLATGLDDDGEDHGPFAHDTTGPWSAQLNNGHAADSFVALSRSAADPNKYAIIVHSNATPQAAAAIKAALAEAPDVTVGEYATSARARRVSALSTLQNKRIAAQFALALGIADLLDIREHTHEKTSTDAYAAPVRYAQPSGMSVYGEATLDPSGGVRISNGVLDLAATQGSAVPLVHSPYHGITVLTRHASDFERGCLRPLRSETADSIAVAPRTTSVAALGADELEEMQRMLHFGDKNEASVLQIAARLGALDPAAEAFADDQRRRAGLGHLQGERFKTLGAIMFP